MSGVGRAGRAALFAALAVSAALPLALLLVWSVADSWFFPALLPSRYTTESWRALASGRLAGAAATSIVIASATGALAAAIALPIGRALAGLRGWRRHLGAAAAFLPVAAPPITLATGLQFTFLVLGLGSSALGVTLAHLVPAAGYTSLYFLGVFAAFDTRIEDEARTLGARPIQVLRHVTLPLLRRPIAEAAALGFLVSWAQVPLTLLVGSGAVRTLPLEVLSYVQAGQDRWAAAGALLLIAPGLAALGAVALGARRAEAVGV